MLEAPLFVLFLKSQPCLRVICLCCLWGTFCISHALQASTLCTHKGNRWGSLPLMAHSNCGQTYWPVLVLRHCHIFGQALFLFALESCHELTDSLFLLPHSFLHGGKDVRWLSCDTPMDTCFDRCVKAEKSLNMAEADDGSVVFIPTERADHAKESLQKNQLGYQHLHCIPQFLLTTNGSWFSFPVRTYSAPLSRRSVIRSRADASVTRRDSVVTCDGNTHVPLVLLFCSVMFTSSRNSVIVCDE